MSTETPKTTADIAKLAKPRTKSEAFDVYRRDEDGTLDLIAENVPTSARGEDARRQEAIVKATKDLPEDRQVGEFVTIKHGEVHSHTRGRKVEPQDIWS